MNDPGERVDVVVVGAGFAGLYALHQLDRHGYSVQGIEAEPDVGGTWYRNRYPGARCDVESADYSYSFSPELDQEWTWTERYASQPEILAYLNHVADRFDLRRHIRFDHRVVAAHFDGRTDEWSVSTDRGRPVRARWLVLAVGGLSEPVRPDIEGLDRFAGRIAHTCDWPRDLDVSGLRVGVIGTGSSGVQIIPELARAARSVTVFQRTPAFSVPTRNRVYTAAEMAALKTDYPARRRLAQNSPGGIARYANPLSAHDHDPTERQRNYEERWLVGGAPAIAGAYADLISDRAANDTAAEFVRAKIRAAVDDPATARRLTPHGFPICTKRLCVDSGYYETYNLAHVHLIDLGEDPIEAVTTDGVRTATGEHRIDVLVLATGFDALTGPLDAMDIRGVGGRPLRAHWESGPRTYLGIAVAGFPNLFLLGGPGSPALLANVVAAVEQQVDWLAAYLDHLAEHAVTRTETEPGAEDAWDRRLESAIAGTLYPQADSWYLGANVPGKPRRFMIFVGGLVAYRQLCQAVAADGYPGFRHTRQEPAMDARAHHVSELADIQYILRNRNFVPVRPESGYHADLVAMLTHDSLADLNGDEHFERRRLLSALFTRAALVQYESDTLTAAIERTLVPAVASGTPVDLLVLSRRILLVLAARIIGLDGLDDLIGDDFARFNDDFVVMERLARAKFIDEPRPLVEPALAAQARLIEQYVRPAWTRRAAALAAVERGEGDDAGLPTDLITLALRHRSHYEQWDADVIGREATLFLNASVGSTAGAVCHTVEDIEGWIAHDPARREQATHREFLRGALAESLRRHANNVLIRTVLQSDALPSGVAVEAGEVLIVDRAAGNRQLVDSLDPGRAGFDPFRSFGGRQPEYGFAFGGGAHTCIARPLVLGVPATSAAGEFTHGVGATILQSLYRYGVRLDAGRAPVRYADMTRDTYRSFPVVFSGSRLAHGGVA